MRVVYEDHPDGVYSSLSIEDDQGDLELQLTATRDVFEDVGDSFIELVDDDVLEVIEEIGAVLDG